MEQLQVLEVRELLKVPSDTDLVAIRRGRSEADSVVELLQTCDCDCSVTARVDLDATGQNNPALRRWRPVVGTGLAGYVVACDAMNS